MKTINEDLKKNTFQNIYLLYGDQSYLKAQYKNKLKDALVADDAMNYSYFEGKDVDGMKVVELGNTLPFFSEKRLIIIENSGLFKKAPEGFSEKIEALPDTTYLIFVEDEMDKRSKLYKMIHKKGYAAQLSAPDEKTLFKWVQALCKEEGKAMEDDVIRYFVEHIGTDMSILKLELEKLFCYCIQKPSISIGEVEEVCINQVTGKLFEMLDAIAEQNQEKSLTYYHDLLDLREPAMRILYLLTRHVHILLQVKELKRLGRDADIAKTVGIPPFTIKKYIRQTEGFTYQQLKNMLMQCQEVEEGVKTGKIQDVVGVELLIVSPFVDL